MAEILDIILPRRKIDLLKRYIKKNLRVLLKIGWNNKRCRLIFRRNLELLAKIQEKKKNLATTTKKMKK